MPKLKTHPLIPYLERPDLPFVNFDPSKDFPEKAEPNPPKKKQNALVGRQVEAWKKMHKGRYFDLACRVADIMTYISYKEWCCALQSTCSEFERRVDGRKYVIVVDDLLNISCGTKSAPWVVQHALKFLNNKPTHIVPSSRVSEVERDAAVWLLDDAAYSGMQICQNLQLLIEMGVYPKNIYVGVPFLTDVAKQKVTNKSVNLLKAKRLETLTDFFTPDEIKLIVIKPNPGITATVFQHKIPDPLSSLRPNFIGFPLACIPLYLADFIPVTRNFLEPSPYKVKVKSHRGCTIL
jgi:hypothetical protein